MVLCPRPVRIRLGPRLVERIRSLLSPFGLRLEEEGKFIIVVGRREDEVRHVASSLFAALSEGVKGKGEGTVVLEDADLSSVERELAKIKRLRKQRRLWRRAGLPDSLEAARRGWWSLEQKALSIETVPLGENQFREVLKEARILHARALAREIHST